MTGVAHANRLIEIAGPRFAKNRLQGIATSRGFPLHTDQSFRYGPSRRWEGVEEGGWGGMARRCMVDRSMSEANDRMDWYDLV